MLSTRYEEYVNFNNNLPFVLSAGLKRTLTNRSTAANWHDNIEIQICTEGEGYVLLDGENGIIAGHGRVLAAKKLGMKQIPTIELQGLSETEKRAYIIADNRLTEKSEWDKDMLGLELADLKALNIQGKEISDTLNLLVLEVSKNPSLNTKENLINLCLEKRN
mgnify:CR=1 FL=1